MKNQKKKNQGLTRQLCVNPFTTSRDWYFIKMKVPSRSWYWRHHHETIHYPQEETLMSSFNWQCMPNFPHRLGAIATFSLPFGGNCYVWSIWVSFGCHSSSFGRYLGKLSAIRGNWHGCSKRNQENQEKPREPREPKRIF